MRTLILLGLFSWALLSGSGDRTAPPRAQEARRTDKPTAAALQRRAVDLTAWKDVASSPSLVRNIQESVRIQSIPAQPQGAYRPRIMTVTPEPEYKPHILMTEPWRPGDEGFRVYLGPRGERPEEVPVIPPDVRRPAPRGGYLRRP